MALTNTLTSISKQSASRAHVGHTRAENTVGSYAIVESVLHELIRRDGIDPAREPATVRALIDQAIVDYATQAAAGISPPLSDAECVAKMLFDAVAGLGPLQQFLDDPEVEEIWINDPGHVFISRNNRSELTTVVLTYQQVTELVERMLKHTGRRIDLSTPFVDATLPDGSRLHVVIPDITREHWAVNIRKFIVKARSLTELVALRTMTAHAACFLEAAVIAGLNVVVAGGTQAGKTTLLNCLAGAIPQHDRIISCEEVFELRLNARDWVPMQTRQPNLEGTGEIPLRRLISEALRMRPSRIIVGEVRQAECLDLLIALNSGLPGMASVHANSAREAITKLCTLPLLAGSNVAASFVVPTVAASVDLVVHLTSDSQGRRRVGEVVALSGRVEGTVIESVDIFATRGNELVRADGFPSNMERFTRAGIDIVRLLNAVRSEPKYRVTSVSAGDGEC